MKDKLLVFQSDFGLLEGTVAQMYGISAQVDPTLRMYDLTHNVTPFDTWEASYSLYQTCHAWPSETVFVSVVDPGVGSARKSVVALTKAGHYIVTPDNGSLTHTAKHVGIVEMREIDESVNRVKGSEDVHIFHGRDVYAYTGARLASGVIDFEGVGPLVPVESVLSHPIIDPEIRENELFGSMEIIDAHFGMLWSNIPFDYFKEIGVGFGDFMDVTIRYKGEEKYSDRVMYGKSFASVEKGEEILYNNEIGNIAIATNLGNFSKKFDLQAGMDWTVSLKKI
jgi:S-adenosylmethionine hydrolase